MIRANHQLETMITDLSSFSFSFFFLIFMNNRRGKTPSKRLVTCLEKICQNEPSNASFKWSNAQTKILKRKIK